MGLRKTKIPAVLAGILLITFLTVGRELHLPSLESATAEVPGQELVVVDESLEDFMKSKLTAINGAMASAARDDYNAVEKAGMDLIQLSKQASWKQRANAAYIQDTADFVAAAEYMVRMAREEDSLGVANSYSAVATCCLTCHRHVRAPRLAMKHASPEVALASIKQR